jgi:hypothetical protein
MHRTLAHKHASLASRLQRGTLCVGTSDERPASSEQRQATQQRAGPPHSRAPCWWPPRCPARPRPPRQPGTPWRRRRCWSTCPATPDAARCGAAKRQHTSVDAAHSRRCCCQQAQAHRAHSQASQRHTGPGKPTAHAHAAARARLPALMHPRTHAHARTHTHTRTHSHTQPHTQPHRHTHTHTAAHLHDRRRCVLDEALCFPPAAVGPDVQREQHAVWRCIGGQSEVAARLACERARRRHGARRQLAHAGCLLAHVRGDAGCMEGAKERWHGALRTAAPRTKHAHHHAQHAPVVGSSAPMASNSMVSGTQCGGYLNRACE